MRWHDSIDWILELSMKENKVVCVDKEDKLTEEKNKEQKKRKEILGSYLDHVQL